MSKMPAHVREILQPRGGVAVANNSPLIVGSLPYLQNVLQVAEENYENACDHQLDVRSKPCSDLDKESADTLVKLAAQSVKSAEEAITKYQSEQASRGEQLRVQNYYAQIKHRIVEIKQEVDANLHQMGRVLPDRNAYLGRELNAALREFDELPKRYSFLKGK